MWMAVSNAEWSKAMLTWKELQELTSRPERADRAVLTLSLNVDQSEQANLNLGFENELKDLLMSIRKTIHAETESKNFDTAALRLEDLVSRHRAGARTVVAVVDAIDGFEWVRSLHVSLPNRIEWDREPVVRPLVGAIDEYEPVGIALVDRANLRVLTMGLGEIREYGGEAFDQRKVRHTKTVGMDTLGAAGHAQKKADQEIRRNLRQMADRVESVVVLQGVNRLIIAGSPEMTNQLRNNLSKRLQSQVIGTVDIAITATIDEIRSAAAPIAEEFERRTEGALVNDLVTSAAKAGSATIGLAHTLEALNRVRVWQLLYVDAYRSPGYQCSSCSALFTLEPVSCSFCGSPAFAVPDVVSRAVDRAVRKGVKVEVIKDEEAQSSFANAGGIGAFLRTRPAGTQLG
jgi:protein required for attachment to host cells